MYKVMHGVSSVTPAKDMAEVAAVVIRLLAHGATNILVVRAETPVTFTMDWKDKRGGRMATMSAHVGLVELKHAREGYNKKEG